MSGPRTQGGRVGNLGYQGMSSDGRLGQLSGLTIILISTDREWREWSAKFLARASKKLV